jgi:hypothetical protein
MEGELDRQGNFTQAVERLSQEIPVYIGGKVLDLLKIKDLFYLNKRRHGSEN